MLHESRRSVLWNSEDHERNKPRARKVTGALCSPLPQSSHCSSADSSEAVRHLSQEDLLVATARLKAKLLALLRSNSQQGLHMYQIW